MIATLTSRSLPTASAPALAAPPPRRFSDELRDLATASADKPMSMGAVLAATQGRGFGLLLVLIALPFITPIPLPGLSTPFGMAVAIIGARLALGKRPWLPDRLLRRELPPRFVGRVLAAARVVVRGMEVVARPRFHFLHEQELFRRVSGALITLSGLLLLLPIPFPLTNTLPAMTVLLLSAGAVERDWLFFIAGSVLSVISVAYFALLGFGGVHALGAFWK